MCGDVFIFAALCAFVHTHTDVIRIVKLTGWFIFFSKIDSFARVVSSNCRLDSVACKC